jgi:hypothetical protein
MKELPMANRKSTEEISLLTQRIGKLWQSGSDLKRAKGKLQVRRVEFEVHNEELQVPRFKIEESRRKYP